MNRDRQIHHVSIVADRYVTFSDAHCWIMRDVKEGHSTCKQYYAKFERDQGRAARRMKRFLWLQSEFLRRNL